MVAEVTEIRPRPMVSPMGGCPLTLLQVKKRLISIAAAAVNITIQNGDTALLDENDNGEILTLPTLELNDQPAIVGRRVSAEEYANMTRRSA